MGGGRNAGHDLDDHFDLAVAADAAADAAAGTFIGRGFEGLGRFFQPGELQFFDRTAAFDGGDGDHIVGQLVELF